MALSEREQRLLDEMERGFYQSEADVMRTSPVTRRRVNYRALVLGIVVLLVGVGVLIGGVIAHQLWLGLIGFVAMLGGVVLMLTRSPESELSETVGVADAQGRSKERARESFSERMERRWDERMEGER